MRTQHGRPAVFLALSTLLVSMSVPATGSEIQGGRLAVTPPGSLGNLPDRLGEDGWLVGRSSDFAVLLLSSTCGDVPGVFPLELVVPGADYYLYLSSDASAAQFENPARLLWSQGHTSLVVTEGGAPQLSLAAIQDGGGLAQPIRISLTPKPWPAAVSGDLPVQRATTFDPRIADIVARIDQTEYTRVWQALDDFETRFTTTTQNNDAAIWMRDVLASYGLEASFFTYNQQGLRKNVVATLPGVLHPESVVYLTGHFDSTSPSAMTSAPGADDNGSGTAAFLEAARILSEYSFEYTIKFVGFNGEEQGLVGSDAYVSSISDAGEDVIGCYNFDMIAYRGNDLGPADLVIYTDPYSTSLATILADACFTFLPTQLEPITVHWDLGASDHASFWAYGYQAVLAIEDEAWGDDFCPWYHTTEDRIEKYPKDYPTDCTKAAVAAVAHTARLTLSPTGVEPSEGPFATRLSLGPNPFRGETRVSYAVARDQGVQLQVFDALGRRVRTLLTGPIAAGTHETPWDGRDESGAVSESGVYWIRLSTQRSSESARVVLVD